MRGFALSYSCCACRASPLRARSPQAPTGGAGYAPPAPPPPDPSTVVPGAAADGARAPRPCCCPTAPPPPRRTRRSQVQAAVWAANTIQKLPYRYGGGHALLRSAPRLRLLGHRLLRAQRAPGCSSARSTPALHALGRARPRRLVHDLHEPRPRVRRDRRAAARHELRRRRRRQGPALARHGPRPTAGYKVAPPARVLSPAPRRAIRAAGRWPGYTIDGDPRLPQEAVVAGMGGRMSTVIKAKISKLLDRPRTRPRRSSTATRSRWSCCRTSRRASPTW